MQGETADRSIMWVICAYTPPKRQELLSAIRVDSDSLAVVWQPLVHLWYSKMLC